jgi:Zn-finger nucleic acid-binding protein
MRLRNKYEVEIDHCPRCRGVWLDRGELEKVANMQNQYEDDYYQKYHQRKDHDDDDYYYHRI